MAIVFAVQKWEQYLTGSQFIIKTDQKSLKWLLEQKITTPFQQFWLSKLLGFDYEIQYHKGVENNVADALSRVQGAEMLCMAITVISSNLKELIRQSYQLDVNLAHMVTQLQQAQTIPHFTIQNGLIKKHNKVLVGPDADLRFKIFTWHTTHQKGDIQEGTIL